MSVINEVEKRLNHNQRHEKFLKETLEALKEKIDMFENEVAYVKDGNNLKPCIVVGVDLPNFKDVLNNQTEVYIRVQTKNGPKSVELSQLVPFNDKSKILFGK